MPSKPILSRMGASTPERIWVQGRDLCTELLGRISLAEMTWLELTGELPTPERARLLDAMLLTLVEHGATPMAIATRLTYFAAPESLQAAVAAGLCGMGSTFAGTAEGAARMLYEADAEFGTGADAGTIGGEIVARRLGAHEVIFGIGHPLHKPIDPRTPVLFALADELGFRGRHCDRIEAIAAAAEARTGKSMPVNATGALGALSCELGLDWRLCRGLAVIGRAVGLVGHIAEELRRPIAKEIWLATEHAIAEAVATEDATRSTV
ncbi:citryl-CoA lyase [Bradyrhizobium sp. USDA 4469]